MRHYLVFDSAFVLFILFSIFSLGAKAATLETSPLCDDLARFSCAPGSYKDGTGEIKSESEIQKFMSNYAEKSRTLLRDRFQSLLGKSENSYFKEVAIAGLGLKNSPACSSTTEGDKKACQENLLDGLTTLAQKQTLGPLVPRTGLERLGNVKDLDYVTLNNAYQKVVKELNDQVQKDLGNAEMSKRIEEKLFPKIKQLIVDRLKKLPISDDKKALMINKVTSIVFEGTACQSPYGQIQKNSHEVISSLLVPNAFYDAGRNTFKLCAGFLLQSTSEFQIAITIAHELSHSIDPCRIAAGPEDLGFKYTRPKDIKSMEDEFPVKNILQCLRDARSVGAVNLSLSADHHAASLSALQRLCQVNKTPYTKEQLTEARTKKSAFCEGDQIVESFADWLAVEVIPDYFAANYTLTVDQYRNGYANANRLGCNIPNESKAVFDEHPPMEARINRILLVNPKVRAQMGCPAIHPDYLYCDANAAPKASDANSSGATKNESHHD